MQFGLTYTTIKVMAVSAGYDPASIRINGAAFYQLDYETKYYFVITK